jgi:hypothetical protein
MVGLALALMIVGIIFGLYVTWLGLTLGLAGLALFLLLVARPARQTARSGR